MCGEKVEAGTLMERLLAELARLNRNLESQRGMLKFPAKGPQYPGYYDYPNGAFYRDSASAAGQVARVPH